MGGEGNKYCCLRALWHVLQTLFHLVAMVYKGGKTPFVSCTAILNIVNLNISAHLLKQILHAFDQLLPNGPRQGECHPKPMDVVGHVRWHYNLLIGPHLD